MKSILDVLYGLLAWFTGYSDNIKSHVEVDTMIAYVSIGRLHDFVNLAICHGIYSISIAVASACLYLYNGKRIIFLRYDIEFLMSQSPVTVANGIPMCHEVGCCAVFAYSSEFVMLSHNN